MKKQISLIILFLVLIGVYLCSSVAAQITCTSGQSPVWSANGWTCQSPAAQPLPAGANVNMTVANASATGTTINRLAKLTGAPSTAVISATTDVDNAVGVCTSGCGATGNATIALIGQVTCDFDGATTAGDYVTISTTTAGKCHDAGATFPTTAAAYGRVLSTNGASGAFVMELLTPDVATQTAISSNGRNKPPGSNTQVPYNDSGQWGADANLTYNKATGTLSPNALTVLNSGSLASGNAATWTGGGTWTQNGNVTYANGASLTIQDNGAGIDYFFRGSSFGRFEVAANRCVGWTNTNGDATATVDTALCRNAASGVIAAGTSDNVVNQSGVFQATNFTNTTTQSGVTPAVTAGVGTVVAGGEQRTVIYKSTLTNANFSAAATTADATVATLPAKTQINGIWADVTTVFSGGAVATANMTCGKTAGGAEYLVSFDVKTATIRRGLVDGDLGTSINRANAVQFGDLPSFTATTTLQCRLTTTGANTNALTQGSITYYVRTTSLP